MALLHHHHPYFIGHIVRLNIILFFADASNLNVFPCLLLTGGVGAEKMVVFQSLVLLARAKRLYFILGGLTYVLLYPKFASWQVKGSFSILSLLLYEDASHICMTNVYTFL